MIIASTRRWTIDNIKNKLQASTIELTNEFVLKDLEKKYRHGVVKQMK